MRAQAASIIDPAYTASLATIPDGQAKADGIALGDVVADTLIALRADDGFRGPQTYTAPSPPVAGVWIPTASTPANAAYMPFMTPFTLTSPDQFRPAGPPNPDSDEW